LFGVAIIHSLISSRMATRERPRGITDGTE
jgi:hypothetical protein